MAKKLQNEDALQSALLRFGDAAFRIAYMHAKKPKDAREILEDVFMQYGLRTQAFKNEEDERFWVLRTTHLACMDYYAKKMRKKLTDAHIQRLGRDMPFIVSKELCEIMKLPSAWLTALAVCFGEEDTAEYAAKITGRPVFLLKKRLDKACARVKLSEEDVREWIQTIQMPDDMRSRILYTILNEAKDKHFSINSKATAFKRRLDRAIPYVALGVIVVSVFCVAALRSGWLGVEYERTPDIVPGTEISAEEDENGESHVTLPESSAESTATLAKLDVSIYVPDDFGLVQYNLSGVEGDASVVAAKMAEKGAFPTSVTLEDLKYYQKGEAVSSLKTGEMLEVRLYFSAELQDYLDTAATTASLEAIARTFDAFYDAANMNLSNLEIYSGGEPVTVNGEKVDCGSLLNGSLQISSIIEE